MQRDAINQTDTESAVTNDAIEATPKTTEQARAEKIVAALYAANGSIRKGEFQLSIEPMSDIITLFGPGFDAAFSAIDLSFLDGTEFHHGAAATSATMVHNSIGRTLGEDWKDFADQAKKVDPAQIARWQSIVETMVA